MRLRSLGREIVSPLRSLLGVNGLGARLDRLEQQLVELQPVPAPAPREGHALIEMALPDGTKYELSIEATNRDAYHEAASAAGIQDSTWSFLIGWLRPDDVFFDLGANIGTISIPAAFRCCSVHAVEMLAENVVHLRRALQHNRIRNVTVVQAAVSDAPGLAGIDGGSAWANVVAESMVLVPALAVDLYARQRGIGHVDVMKIDIEGSERRALAGAVELIARDHPDIIIESNALTCGNNGYSYRDLLRRLRTFGYAIYRIHSGRLCPWPEDAIQELVYVDYLATTKGLPGIAARSGWDIAPMSDADTVSGILSAADYDKHWRLHVLAIADRLPQPVLDDARVKEALREWAPLASDAMFEVLRTGSA